MAPAQASASAACGGEPSRSAIVGAAVSGHHQLVVERYSLTKDLPNGECVKSLPFRAGGHTWRILCYPNGWGSRNAGFISVFLRLDDVAAGPVGARAAFSLLDRAGKPVPSETWTTGDVLKFFNRADYGCGNFINRAWLEKSKHLADDRFTIRCDIAVSQAPRAEERRAAAVPSRATAPPSSSYDLRRQLGGLLSTKDGVDVTFRVAGERFQAHRCILAARSPVFKAELFGPMREGSNTTTVVEVHGVEADVFRAMLAFVYTDALPEMKHEEEHVMCQHLLVAADRYDLEGLKLICENKLCNHIDTDSAAIILALAEQHRCCRLKEACLQFLSSASALKAVMETEGFDNLARSCPCVLKELIPNIAHDPFHIDRREPIKINYWYQGLVLAVLCIVLYFKGGNVLLSSFCFIVASYVTVTLMI